MSKLLKCIVEFNEIIKHLMCSGDGGVAADVVVAVMAILTAPNNTDKSQTKPANNNNCNRNYGKSMKFKHFLSHRKMRGNFKLTYNSDRHIETSINDHRNSNGGRAESRRYSDVGRRNYGSTGDIESTVEAIIFIPLIVRIVIIIVFVVVSFIILQILFSICLLRVRLLVKIWRMWHLLRLTMLKMRMWRVLQKFCKANCAPAKLDSYKTCYKRQDISSFTSYLFIPKAMKRSIVVQMVQMLVKNDKNPATCATQVSPNAALDAVTANISTGSDSIDSDDNALAVANELNGMVSSNVDDTSCNVDAPSTSSSLTVTVSPKQAAAPAKSTKKHPKSSESNRCVAQPKSPKKHCIPLVFRSCEQTTNQRPSPPHKMQKSLAQTTNFVRIVKATPQPLVQNVLRTVATKSTANVLNNVSIAADASAAGKQISQNLFIYNTEGKLIRLTPLVGGNNNCYATSAVEAMPATTISSDGGDATKEFLSLQSAKGDEQKNYVAIKLNNSNDDRPAVSGSSVTSSPMQFNAFVVANTTASMASTTAKHLLPTTRSIYEETYAKFLKSKESTISVQSDGVTDSIDGATLKKAPSQAATIMQCHPLLKSGTVITSAAKPTTTNIIVGGGSGAGPFRPLQNFTFAKGGAADGSAGTNIQLIDNVDRSVASSEIKSSTGTNQFRITFPLISSSTGRGDSMRTVSNSNVLPMSSQQVILTGPSQSRRIQSLERAKLIAKKSSTDGRNVDHFTLEQLREFDMVLEQVKERSTTTTATTITTATSVAPVTGPEILTASCLNAFGRQRRVSLIGGNGQSISTATGLLQKINLAILKKNSPDSANIKGNTKPSVSQPIVVVATANCSPSNVNNVILSPTTMTNIIQNSTPTPAEQIGDAGMAPSNAADENKNRTKSNIDSPSLKSLQTQSKSSASVAASTASPSAKPSNKSQEDEQTVQRIYDILAQYAEQISSSPDLNNKPAPRRRSNLVSGLPQTSAACSKASGSSATKASSIITTACLSSGNSSESSSQGTPSYSQTPSRKRVKSTSVSISAESNDYIDSAEDTDATPEKRHRPNSATRKLPLENRDTTYARADQLHCSSSGMNAMTNMLKRNGTQTANRFVLSNGVMEPLTIGIPTNLDGSNSGTANANEALTMPNQTVNVLISGNYLLPMGMIKSNRIGGNETVICSANVPNKGANAGQALRPNLATLMFSRNATDFHTDMNNVTKAPILNNQKIQFQAIKMAQPKCVVAKSMTSIPGVGTATAPFASTILVPTITTHVPPEAKSSTIGGSEGEFKVNDTASTKFASQIFQSNRGIIILNKKGTSAVSSSPVATITVPTTTSTASQPSMIAEPSATDDFLLPLNTASSPTREDETSQSMPLSFVDDTDPIFEEVVDQELLNVSPHQYHDHLYQHDNDRERIVIIDKEKSDALTLNSASNRRHGDLHIKTRNDIERQLRLQKSLSEECEDLGVDEPSTSELFPEAELSFDNNSPIAFDALSSHGTSSNAAGRTTFDFSNHRLPAKVMKKIQKRNSDKEMNVFDVSECDTTKTIHYEEMSSIGLNHTAYKDFSDSDGPSMDDFDGTLNAYSMKNAIIMDKMDKSTSSSTRIYRDIRNTNKIINKSNRLRRNANSAGVTAKSKSCHTASPFSLDGDNNAKALNASTMTNTRKNSPLDHSRSTADKYTPCLG